MRTSVLVAALALAAVAAAPALVDEPVTEPLAEGCTLVDLGETPDDVTDDVQLCESQHFFRAGDAPVSNVATAVLSTEAPTLPYGGAGFGTSVTDIAVQGDPAHGLEVNGTVTGAVDSIDVTVYVASPNGLFASHGTTPQLVIGGYNFGGQLVDTVATGGPNGTIAATFRFSGMLELWPLLSFDTSPDAEHSVRLNLSQYYIGDDGAYLYDGTDVPSNIVVNAAG